MVHIRNGLHQTADGIFHTFLRQLTNLVHKLKNFSWFLELVQHLCRHTHLHKQTNNLYYVHVIGRIYINKQFVLGTHHRHCPIIHGRTTLFGLQLPGIRSFWKKNRKKAKHLSDQPRSTSPLDKLLSLSLVFVSLEHNDVGLKLLFKQ